MKIQLFEGSFEFRYFFFLIFSFFAERKRKRANISVCDTFDEAVDCGNSISFFPFSAKRGIQGKAASIAKPISFRPPWEKDYEGLKASSYSSLRRTRHKRSVFVSLLSLPSLSVEKQANKKI